MVCDVCGKNGAQTRLIPRNYGHGEDLFVMEGIPLISCPNCGESYLDAETLHAMERIKLHRKELGKPRSVSVANFA